MNCSIRRETAGDEAGIHALTMAAFHGHPHSDGSEPQLIDRLRREGDLALSLLAEEDGQIIGHIAFSPATIADGTPDWFGLGPVSVRPDRQGQGIGAALIGQGLAYMQARNARGIVLLGDPGYYGRFGFVHDLRLTYPGPPPEYFQRRLFSGDPPVGTVRYAPAFG